MNGYQFIWEDVHEKPRMNSHMAPGATVLQFEVHQAKSPAEKQTACTLYAERKDAQRTGPATNNPSVDIFTARIVPELQLIKK